MGSFRSERFFGRVRFGLYAAAGWRGETVECVRAMALGVNVLVRTGSIVLFVMFVSAVGCQQRAHSETFCSDKRRGRNSLGITLVERSSRKVE